MVETFVLECTDDKLWNLVQFVEYLAHNNDKDIQIFINPEAIDVDELDVFKYIDAFNFKSVTIITRNPFQTHPRYKIKYLDKNWFFETPVTIDHTVHTWNQSKIFLCAYARPIAARLGFAGWLNHNYRDQTVIQFTTRFEQNNPNFEFDKLAQYDLDSVGYAIDIVKQLPIETVDSALYYKDIHRGGVLNDTAMFDLYKNIFVDVVAENHNQGETFFPTEKIARPIYCKKPFVVFAGKDYCHYLHQTGFKTFYNYWSQTYDGYKHRDRYCAMLDILKQIGNKSKTELADMLDDMQPILDHNYNLLMDKTYNYNFKKPL